MITCPRCLRRYQDEPEVCVCGQRLAAVRESPVPVAAPAAAAREPPAAAPEHAATPQTPPADPEPPVESGPGTWFGFTPPAAPGYEAATPAADVELPTAPGDEAVTPDADPYVPPPAEAESASPLPDHAIAAETVHLSLRVADGEEDGPAHTSVAAGGRVTLFARVRNQSSVVDNYDLRIDGLPPAGGRSSPRRCTCYRSALQAPTRASCRSPCTRRAHPMPRPAPGHSM